jgi:hypothetical protein
LPPIRTKALSPTDEVLNVDFQNNKLPFTPPSHVSSAVANERAQNLSPKVATLDRPCNPTLFQNSSKLEEGLSLSADSYTGPNRVSEPGHKRARYCKTIEHYFHPASSATALLTNNDYGWSNYCACLRTDGHIDLLHSNKHRSVADVLIRADKDNPFRQTAIYGTWISPGGIAVVDIDCRTQRNQITVLDFEDNVDFKPRMTILSPQPHGPKQRITTVAKLWVKHSSGKRKFATGGRPAFIMLTDLSDTEGRLILWDVSPDGTAAVMPLHHQKDHITTLAYCHDSHRLFSAAKKQLQVYDMVTGKPAGDLNSGQMVISFKLI